VSIKTKTFTKPESLKITAAAAVAANEGVCPVKASHRTTDSGVTIIMYDIGYISIFFASLLLASTSVG
jgi:hypothetical protein